MTLTTSRIIGAFVVIILALVVWRVVDLGMSSRPPHDGEKVTIATTIYPLYDIVKQVAGDNFEVIQLTPAGADPHDFEPVPSMAETLEDVPVVYAINYNYDEWAKDIVGVRTDVISLTADIPRHVREGAETDIDPHFWLSIPNARQIADLAARDLSSRFPELKAEIAANRDAYITKLDAADAEIRSRINAMSEKSIVTMHDAWYYFANAYGLTVIGTFEEAGSEEPSARHITELADTMREAGITTIFGDYGHEEPALTAFADDNDVTIMTLDPEGAAGSYNSYIDLMLSNAEIISKNQ